jgi:phospholipase/lecithinase/hemolysin
MRCHGTIGTIRTLVRLFRHTTQGDTMSSTSSRLQTGWQRALRGGLLALTAAAFLNACGGGGVDGSDSRPVKSVVSFGDSLSDVGTYSPAAASFGSAGRFTTNVAGTQIWNEIIAARLGSLLTTYETGGFTLPIVVTGGNGYAQGGARVTLQPGVGNAGLNAAGNPAAAITLPVVSQVDAHLARNGSFRSDQVVLVWAGANDLFTQLAIVGGGGSAAAAQVAVQTAAVELAAQVGRIASHGARYIVVLNLPDLGKTPAFAGTAGAAGATGFTQLFNGTLAAQVAALNNSGIVMVDVYTTLNAVIAAPAQYGFSNVTQTACVNAPNNSSLFCSSATLASAAAPNTYLFADSVHPTTAGHKLIASTVVTAVAGKIPL